MHPCMRGFSSVHTQQPAGPVREIDLDPYIMLDDDIKYVTQDIRDVSIYCLLVCVCMLGNTLSAGKGSRALAVSYHVT